MSEPFAVKDCALVGIGTGVRAQNLRELRDHLLTIHPGSIYYHFWGGMLRPHFDEPEYQNDFAAWAWRGLHDARLAERLAVVDPAEFSDVEDLRRELVDIIEERLEETEMVPWAKSSDQFYFTRSQIVVFDTELRIPDLDTLIDCIPRMSVGSIFYHYIDARRRTASRMDDFSEWLISFGDGYRALVECVSAIDPYFSTLIELRGALELGFKSCRLRGGV
jgi:hypothetical protein